MWSVGIAIDRLVWAMRGTCGSASGCLLYLRPYGSRGAEQAANCSTFVLRKNVERFALLTFFEEKNVEKLYPAF